MTIADKVKFTTQAFPKEWNLPPDLTGRIIVGGLYNWKDECYYLIDFEKKTIQNCTIDVSSYINDMENYLRANVELRNLPYSSPSHHAAVFNFIQPHEGLELKNGRILFAMHNASYAREIDFTGKCVSQFSSSEVFYPQMMSATNSLDKEGNNLFYSVTDMGQRLQKYEGRSINLDTTVFSVDINLQRPEKILQLKTDEVIHEVKLCPDGKHIILTEFFLATPGEIPSACENVFNNYESWVDYENAGLHTSNLYLLNRISKTYNSITVNNKTPGHIEFSNKIPNRFYLSSHNLSKAHGKLILHGRASVIAGEINSGTLNLITEFSKSNLYRATSHKVFKFNQNSYIALTVYPNKFFIMSDPDLELIKDVELYPHPPVDSTKLHFCNLLPHMPLWIEVSDNGAYIILVSNEYIYVFDMNTGILNRLHGFSFNGNFIGTAHITNLNDFPA